MIPLSLPEAQGWRVQEGALAGAGEKYLLPMPESRGVKVLPSGLQYKVIKEE